MIALISMVIALTFASKNCSKCTWVLIELKLNNYPDETSWSLASIDGKSEMSVLSGE